MGRMAPRRSALIIEIPEAEPVVAEPRSRLDRVAALGVPAHVTALFPFVPADSINKSVLYWVREVTAAVAPFDYRFTRTAWFDQHVLYLAPDPAEHFRELTERLWAAFPDCPPYGGQFDEVVPHLTIGEGANVHDLLDAEGAVRAHGAVEGRAHRLTLMAEGDTGRWSRLGYFPLGTNEEFRQPL
jgi:2'-5' RNA ligase